MIEKLTTAEVKFAATTNEDLTLSQYKKVQAGFDMWLEEALAEAGVKAVEEFKSKKVKFRAEPGMGSTKTKKRKRQRDRKRAEKLLESSLEGVSENSHENSSAQDNLTSNLNPTFISPSIHTSEEDSAPEKKPQRRRRRRSSKGPAADNNE